MKEWWDNLAQREKMMVGSGGIIVGVFLVYILFWSPFTSHIEQLNQDVQKQRALSSWMQEKVPVILQGQAKAPKRSQTSHTSLLSLLETSLSEGSISRWKAELSQGDDDDVQVKFKEVAFVDLTVWLHTLDEKNGVIVDKITLTPLEKSGLTQADILLGR